MSNLSKYLSAKERAGIPLTTAERVAGEVASLSVIRSPNDVPKGKSAQESRELSDPWNYPPHLHKVWKP